MTISQFFRRLKGAAGKATIEDGAIRICDEDMRANDYCCLCPLEWVAHFYGKVPSGKGNQRIIASADHRDGVYRARLLDALELDEAD